MQNNKNRPSATKTRTSLTAITAAALVLPGLLPALTHAADDDSVDFQYSHYQEGKRIGNVGYQYHAVLPSPQKYVIPNNRSPIEVDSLHGSAKVNLTDRVKFAFNYLQDTWSGATPMASAPELTDPNEQSSGALGYNYDYYDDKGDPVITGASPLGGGFLRLDKKGNNVFGIYNFALGRNDIVKDRIVHVMSYASPETRQQGDFSLTREWDEMSLTLGGGISVESDYESRFVNLGGRFDFNQKQTTLDTGLSYTNSDIDAQLNPYVPGFYSWSEDLKNNLKFDPKTGAYSVRGTRQDWAVHLGLTQVINKNALLKAGLNYTRSTGYLGNPYKFSFIYDLDSKSDLGDYVVYQGTTLLEQRPEQRNLWQWQTGWVQYVEPLNAALHFDYSFAHDDWGINAHTFEADWVQPLGWGWTVTPRIRYYSQSAADFYSPYFLASGKAKVRDGHKPPISYEEGVNAPDNFSSDQRLSGFGTLSGGVTVSKQFAKGLTLETGFEYYTHQGSLKLGGGGEGSFADYDYWVANAALKVNLSAIGQSTSNGGHLHHISHPNVPAGVMFGHTLSKAGDMMAGYRYMRNWQMGGFLASDRTATQTEVIANGCPTLAEGCSMLPREMTMQMHMLDLMYAPTDWLTLMLMPQFTTMAMHDIHPGGDTSGIGHSHSAGNAVHDQETGGIGDTGMYALVKLFDHPNHHIHATLGFTAPTGDVRIKNKSPNKNIDTTYAHYGMQLGSGTWDFKPIITYTGKADVWSWGAQAAGTKRLESRNDAGYALGDMFEGSLWGGYDLNNWLVGTVRVAYTWQGAIKGQFPALRSDEEVRVRACPKFQFTTWNDYDLKGNPVGPGVFDNAGYQTCLNGEAYKNSIKANKMPIVESPADATANYGGHYVDVGFGLSATVPTGSLAGNRLAFEWLQPVYTNVNGYQLDRDGALSFTWSYGF
jgi:Protein of unknown function (DUF3570)